jgi:hypothetical protein
VKQSRDQQVERRVDGVLLSLGAELSKNMKAVCLFARLHLAEKPHLLRGQNFRNLLKVLSFWSCNQGIPKLAGAVEDPVIAYRRVY